MTRPAGANARSLEAFVLARELRRARARTGLKPKEVASLAGIPRNKLDAVELGDIGRPNSPKRPGRLSRAELVRLVLLPAYGFARDEAEALLLIGHQSGAASSQADYFALAADEWRAHRASDPPGYPIAQSEIHLAAKALIERHRCDFPPSPTVTLLGAPASPDLAEKQEWDLPAQRCAVFAGREAEVRQLVQILAAPASPRVVVVSGPGGVGKSELAREALTSREVRASHHGLRWISVRNHESDDAPARRRARLVGSTDVLRALAGSLSVGLDGLGPALESEVWLVVVDNAEVIEDEEELFARFAAIAARSRLLVTSRRRYTNSFVVSFPASGPLAGLPISVAGQLVLSETTARGGSVGRLVESATADQLGALHRVTGGAPLALRWVAARSCRTQLPEVIAGLQAGAAEDLYASMFERSWRELTKAPRDVLDFLARGIEEPAPEELLERCGVGLGQLRPALGELAAVSLVERSGPEDAYGVHPLASVFVRQRVRSSRWRDGQAWRSGLEYLRESLADDTRGAGAALPLGGLRNYLRWMEEAIGASGVVEAIVAWTKLSRYLWEHWRWDLYGPCGELGLRAVDLLSTRAPSAARMLRALALCDGAFLDFERGRFSEAIAGSNAALAIFDELGDRIGYALAARYRGLAEFRSKTGEGRGAATRSWRGALASVRQASEPGYPPATAGVRRAMDELSGLGLWEVISGGYQMYRGVLGPSEAQLHRLIGGAQLEEGDLGGAEEHFLHAISTLRSESGRWAGSEASPLIGLADVYAKRGEHDRSARTLAEALELARAADRRDLEGDVLLAFTRIERSRGNTDRAIVHARAAEELLSRIGADADAREARELIRSLTEPRGPRDRPPAARV